MRRITIRRDGQPQYIKAPDFNFGSNKLPEHIKAGYMRFLLLGHIYQTHLLFQVPTVWAFENFLPRTLTCARCEVGHESTDCTRTEKCVNCKGEHTHFLELFCL
ncbi:hypothetical protein AVEN_131185-1 [Araneus ventricosus]|uniref:Uncharacterized protein n=1 Tax=Araneus ventricosus TaxID=182803 RepID=A0A4Y2MLM4_ARAVE|nr:hypothetical protein AVEN_131185-1 [Araneus ventricosus]